MPEYQLVEKNKNTAKRNFFNFVSFRSGLNLAICLQMSHLIGSLIGWLPSNNRLERIWKIAQVDFQSRYYNDKLGLLWALIKPIFEACLYFFAFKYFLGNKDDGLGLFIFGGIVSWMVFAEGSSRSIGLLRTKSYLIENVQFNHIDLFFSHVSSTFFAYIFNFSAFLVIAWIFGQHVTSLYLLIPVVALTLYLITMAASFILATLQPFLKDITHLWDMVILSGFWLSGVIFDPKLIFDQLPWFPYINPFIGIIQNMRSIVIDKYDFSYYWMFYNFIFALCFYCIGYIIFKRYSRLALEKL